MLLFSVIICLGFGVIGSALVWVWVLYLSFQLFPFVNKKTDKNLFLQSFYLLQSCIDLGAEHL